MKKTPNERTYRGGCHCGRVRFEVRGKLDRVSECNCSICAKKAYLHWIVERTAFRLLTPSDNIASYTFNTKAAKHLFCPNCGVASFYIPRSDPERIDVNVRCLEGVNLEKLEHGHFDGRNWEKAFQERERDRAAK
ncbi:GFA family protein [Candidatus Binatus sp.]|uniref:GFA family protein n=1 Tax=Candidatus Binatus sp. TaxID=2811406 RepID=UPI003C61F746